MRAPVLILILGLTACGGTGANQGNAAASFNQGAGGSEQVVSKGSASQPELGSFTGVWASCDGAAAPEECSRYILLQRDARICGTWSYFASGQAFEGRVVAHANSESKARRTHVCGRPGSETNTECDAGWQAIDQPLELCGGRLSDLAGADGGCFADYEAVPASQADLAALEAEAWAQTCLTTDP